MNNSIQEQLDKANLQTAKTAQQQAVKSNNKSNKKNGLAISIPDGIITESFITSFNPVYNTDKTTKEKTLACFYIVLQRNQFTNQRGKDLQQMSTKTLRQVNELFTGSETFTNPHFEKLVVSAEKLNESLSS